MSGGYLKHTSRTRTLSPSSFCENVHWLDRKGLGQDFLEEPEDLRHSTAERAIGIKLKRLLHTHKLEPGICDQADDGRWVQGVHDWLAFLVREESPPASESMGIRHR